MMALNVPDILVLVDDNKRLGVRVWNDNAHHAVFDAR